MTEVARGSRLALPVLLALALLVEVGKLDDPFRIDDVEQIPLSGEKLGDELGPVRAWDPQPGGV